MCWKPLFQGIQIQTYNPPKKFTVDPIRWLPPFSKQNKNEILLVVFYPKMVKQALEGFSGIALDDGFKILTKLLEPQLTLYQS